MIYKCNGVNCQLFEMENMFLKTTTLIMQSTELHLSKSIESLHGDL